jgi:hypothetical protein
LQVCAGCHPQLLASLYRSPLQLLRELQVMSHRKPHLKVFDPDDSERVSVSQVGVWTIYQEILQPDLKISSSSWLNWRRLLSWRPALLAATTFVNVHYAVRIIKDLWAAAPLLVVTYLLVSLLQTVFPALLVYYSGQMLNLVHNALDTRKIVVHDLTYVVGARALCAIASWLSLMADKRAETALRRQLTHRFERHILQAHLRVDVPTSGDPAVMSQLNCQDIDDEGPWSIFYNLVSWCTSLLQLCASLVALLLLLWSRKEYIPLAVVHMVQPLLRLWERAYSSPALSNDGGTCFPTARYDSSSPHSLGHHMHQRTFCSEDGPSKTGNDCYVQARSHSWQLTALH